MISFGCREAMVAREWSMYALTVVSLCECENQQGIKLIIEKQLDRKFAGTSFKRGDHIQFHASWERDDVLSHDSGECMSEISELAFCQDL